MGGKDIRLYSVDMAVKVYIILFCRYVGIGMNSISLVRYSDVGINHIYLVWWCRYKVSFIWYGGIKNKLYFIW